MAMSRRDMLKATAAGLTLPSVVGSTANVWGQTDASTSSKKSYALHIGVNLVNPAGYKGWDGKLNGCENDADTYKGISTGRFTKVRTLKTRSATVGNVASHILYAAKDLKGGDTLLVTYAGHGGKVRDASGDESDRVDETWCLFDRQIADDELNRLWRYFRSGVRIVVLSDSCHSGTVTRTMDAAVALEEGGADRSLEFAFGATEASTISEELKTRARDAQNATTRSFGTRAERLESAASSNMFRQLPPELVDDAYEAQRSTYDAIDRSISTGDSANQGVQASVLLISGCQDDQLSLETNNNGLFTTTLKKVWNGGSFSGNYKAFRDKIASNMPSKQQPNYFVIGAKNEQFEKETPFTV